jgi:hypothetical protein
MDRLQLDAIPNAGYSGPFLSYLSAFRYGFLDRKAMIKEGYEKVTSSLSSIQLHAHKLMPLRLCESQSRPGLFRIPKFRRWIVFAGGAESIEDIRKAPEGILSAHKPNAEVCTGNTGLTYT